MKDKKIIYPVLVFLCMFIIFCFSNQNAQKSQSLSDEVAKKTFEIQKELTKKESTSMDEINFIKNTRILIRKSAHFFIYFILGILLYFTLKVYQWKHPILSTILLCFLYACSDEFHQYFVSERTARILDVFLDTCGATVGVCLTFLFVKKKEKECLKN